MLFNILAGTMECPTGTIACHPIIEAESASGKVIDNFRTRGFIVEFPVGIGFELMT